MNSADRTKNSSHAIAGVIWQPVQLPFRTATSKGAWHDPDAPTSTREVAFDVPLFSCRTMGFAERLPLDGPAPSRRGGRDFLLRRIAAGLVIGFGAFGFADPLGEVGAG